MDKIPESQWDGAKDEAVLAAHRAHAPYSNFRVGCAVVMYDDDTGEYSYCVGNNVENASYGMTICAERSALFNTKTVEPETGSVRGIAVFTETPTPSCSCGACRQVMFELCPKDTPVRYYCRGEEFFETTVGALLPHAFVLP